MQKIVQIKDLIHKFVDTDAEGNVTGEKNAVDSVSLDVEKGEFIATWDIMDPANRLWQNILMPY